MFIVRKTFEQGTTYIGRGSPFGNPFPMGDRTDEERDCVCEAHKKYFYDELLNQDYYIIALYGLIKLHKNKGEVKLGCYCSPKRCHGDVIAEYLNAYLENPETHELGLKFKALNLVV